MLLEMTEPKVDNSPLQAAFGRLDKKKGVSKT